MKKWKYKVVPFKSSAEDTSNHNIDLSAEEGKKRKEKSRSDTEDALNELGEQGWELIGSFKEFALLKKPK